MTAKFTALLNEHIAISMPVALTTSSGATRTTAMPLKAIEGDSDGAKISYFHHWIDTEGQAQVETWINDPLKLEDPGPPHPLRALDHLQAPMA